jgi:phospholipid transport system substrate-binding protein
MHVAVLLALALAADAGSATAALKERDAEVRAALPPKGVPSPEVRKKVEGIITRTVDLEGMLQAALGQRWKDMKETQRKRLVAAFERRFRDLSGRELDTYRSTQIEYLPEKESDADVAVPTKVVVEGEPTEIAYTMRREKAGWRIVDIAVDGVSTVQNYRSSFNRVIQKEGVDGLIGRLEKGSIGKKPAASASGGAAKAP